MLSVFQIIYIGFAYYLAEIDKKDFIQLLIQLIFENVVVFKY
jgi:hypothetical protein